MLNQVILIGRLVTDPEIKKLDDNKKLSFVTLAVQRSFKNQDGVYDTDFISVVLWEGIALAASTYLKKGCLVALKGRIQSYKKEINGTNVTLHDVIAEKITYLDKNYPKEKE